VVGGAAERGAGELWLDRSARRPTSTSMRVATAAGLVLVLTAGCGPARGTDAGSPAATAAVEVPWADYGPGVRSRIDSWAASGACDRLRDTRDTAVADGDAVRRRTGHGNEALIAYLDAVSRAAGCPDRS